MNRRKAAPLGKKILLLCLLLVAAGVVIGGAFFLLEPEIKHKAQQRQRSQTAEPAPRLPLPPRPLQENVSSVTRPVQKTEAVEKAVPQGSGKVAVIIDDMGSSMKELDALLSIKLPLTFSIIPSLAHAKGVAEAAHRSAYEVMVHMPMEPEGYPRQPMESIGLLLSMPDSEVSDRVGGYFRTVPHAAGANNHMGSRFTQSRDKMDVVLKVLKEKQVFFVDSRTSGASVGYERAKALGMRAAARQVFLDNVQDEAAIGKQLEQAAAIARKKGSAIAIGHPHPPTIRALQARMPELAKSGITFVSASVLTK